MSARGGGRGGGRGVQPSPNAGRGQPSRGGGGGSGRGRGGRGNNPPPPSSVTAPAYQPSPPPQSVAAVSREVEKLSLGASSSAQPPAPAPVNPPRGQPEAISATPPQSQGQQVSAPASSKSMRNPLRPGFGTFGTKTVVKANHFLVTVADRDLHHYDVSISPEVASKKVCREIMNEFVTCYRISHLGKRMLAYDGRKSCYCAGPLPFISKEFNVKLVDQDGQRREREFKVAIKFASKADLHHLSQFLRGRQPDVPQETLQFLDVVLRESPSKRYEVVGRSFFAPELGGKGELGNGLEYWKGFYQSLRPTQMGLSLNIDMSARAFFEPILVSEYVFKYINNNPSKQLTDQDRIKIKKALRGVRVEVNHSGHIRRHKIIGLTTEPVNKVMFTLDDTGAQLSVAQYFRQQYNIVLKHQNLPCIQAGNAAKPTSLPMEICKIVPGQRYSKKLNERQVTALLKATCQRPPEREKSITNMQRAINYNNDELVNTEFGINVGSELTTIDARVLPPPMLKYGENGRENRVAPSVGQWNMIDKTMVNGGKVDSWACICFASSRNFDVDRFCHELIGMCCSKGMAFNPEPLFPVRYEDGRQIEKALFDVGAENAKAKVKLQLLVIVLPDYTGSYGTIKRICETELGIVSQCCQPKQAGKFSKQYMENVALKMNVKVGGRNTVLEQALFRKMPYLSEVPTIIFGADVTHPQPGEDSSPSIAAVVASMDWPEVTKYRGLVSAQGHRDEIIQDLYNVKTDAKRGIIHGGMIREHLVAFYKSTRQKPHRIIFYRDGVSEGQFNQVLLYEVDAIRKACNSIEENYMPRITFVVVQKRHHTRLFPQHHGDRRTTDRSGNILPGTVVDTKICHPTEFDFYLCSHAGIQGTSRPAHYHVLYDENRFTADGLQVLTNSLCYTFARCTRSVSIVPPAYYAHLAAFRARYYIEGLDSSDSGSAAPGGGGTRDRNQEVRPLPVIKENVKDVMFYC